MSNTAHCPHCGKRINVELTAPTARSDWGAIQRAFSRKPAANDTYEHSVPAIAAPSYRREAEDDHGTQVADGALAPGESRTMTTYRTADIRSDVAVPILAGIAGGTFIGLLSVPITIAAHGAWWIPPVTWVGTSGVLWAVLSRRLFTDQAMITQEVEMTSVPPAPLPAPTPAQRSVRALAINVATDPAGRHTEHAELPDTPEFLRFVAMVVAGASFSEQTAEDAEMALNVPSATEPDEMGFRQIRDLFVARHWAAWRNRKNHRLGVKLLASGLTILRHIAADSTPPLTESEGTDG